MKALAASAFAIALAGGPVLEAQAQDEPVIPILAFSR